MLVHCLGKRCKSQAITTSVRKWSFWAFFCGCNGKTLGSLTSVNQIKFTKCKIVLHYTFNCHPLVNVNVKRNDVSVDVNFTRNGICRNSVCLPLTQTPTNFCFKMYDSAQKLNISSSVVQFFCAHCQLLSFCREQMLSFVLKMLGLRTWK